MRRNDQLIEGSDLLSVIVEKIEASYADDVSLLICYGSYITGDYGALSDIDFFFVPETKRGYELTHQFILNKTGYDLWPVSWERLKTISTLEEQPTSILMDGQVLFAASDEDLRKLQDLKESVTQNLNNEIIVRKMARKYIDKAKALYYGLRDYEAQKVFVDAMNITETLLVAVATLNGTYMNKGLKRIKTELGRLSKVPTGFLENYRSLIRTHNKTEHEHIVNELIYETDKLYKSMFDRDQDEVDFSELAVFYEEFKSAYNKLLLACDEKSYEICLNFENHFWQDDLAEPANCSNP